MTTVPDLNFGDMFDAVAAEIPERTAIIYGDTRYDWKTFDARSNSLARTLLAAGIGTGAKVAFYLRNSPAYLELFSACAKARLTHANVNYRYVDAELFHVLDNSDAEVVVYDEAFLPQIEALRPRLSGVTLYLQVGGTPPVFAASFADACVQADTSPLGITRSGSDLYFMYTGGTTGYPKAVMWEHHNRIAVINMTTATSAEEHAALVAGTADAAVVLPACPLMHSTGFTTAVSTLVNGGTIVLLPTANFSAEECLDQIERNGITRMAIVGDAFSVPILEHLRHSERTYDLSSVELINSAGAMWSADRKQALLEYFPNAVLSDSLGSSEGSRLGSAVMRSGETSTTAAFHMGPDVKVFSEDLREIVPGSGEAGMIATCGPIPLGYYKDPERTEATFPTINGVRYSMAGDWCIPEADGTMTLLGRGNNCINSGGEKVFPEEVEEVLKTWPGISDVAVTGTADARWGQAVTALVRVNEALDEQALAAFLGERLARYKHPKHYVTTDADFRHANGKVNYRRVRKLLGIE